MMRLRTIGATALAVAFFSCRPPLTGDSVTLQADHRYPARQSRADRAPVAFGSLRASLADQHAIGTWDLRHHLANEKTVQWTKAASLMLQGHESCVDGRDTKAVLGTPGGDAGELLVALAATEAATGRAISEPEVEIVFSDYVEAFGRFYLHTDDHALEELGKSLKNDQRIKGRKPKTARELEGFVKNPPYTVRRALLEHLVEPQAIGCGHLRLIASHPQEYEVRPELLSSLLRVFYERLWAENSPSLGSARPPKMMDFEVLHGSHGESAVLQVVLEEEHRVSHKASKEGRPLRVYPFTSVPMISPSVQGGQMFVLHPQVAELVRRQNVAFLISEGLFDELDEVESEAVEARINRLAEHQLSRTVHYLAEGLPVFEARFRGRGFTVRKVTSGAQRSPAPTDRFSGKPHQAGVNASEDRPQDSGSLGDPAVYPFYAENVFGPEGLSSL